jgi:uncharacterized protein YhbP (UPF0306 family)
MQMNASKSIWVFWVSEPNIPLEIVEYIQEHHVMSLATQGEQTPSVCSVFYAFIPEEKLLIFASESHTEHIQNIFTHPYVAAGIHNEEREVNAIKGVQIKGEVRELDVQYEGVYHQRFPEAKSFEKTLWGLELSSLKYTDNARLGLGNKMLWP